MEETRGNPRKTIKEGRASIKEGGAYVLIGDRNLEQRPVDNNNEAEDKTYSLQGHEKGARKQG